MQCTYCIDIKYCFQIATYYILSLHQFNEIQNMPWDHIMVIVVNCSIACEKLQIGFKQINAVICSV